MAIHSSDDRPEIFIAQSGPYVEPYLGELEEYLAFSFRVWHDRKQSGRPPDPIIRKRLEDCGGAVLLVDIKFLTSDYIRDIEVPTLWTRFAPEGITVIGVPAGDVASLVELKPYTDPRPNADPREFLLSEFDWVPRGYTSNDKRHHRASPLSQLERGDRESYYAEIVASFRRFFDEQPASDPSPPPPDAVDTLQARLARVSSALLGWKQTIEQQWLERPEFDQIVKRITGSEHSTTLLLGRPGSGKSALLAKLGREFQNLDTSVLAIKADLLSADVCTPAALAAELELPSDTVAVIRKIANSGHRCLVLLDQLDVLAGFVEKRPERLKVLTGLLTALSGVPGVHVVASCREFEHRYDTRLQNLSDEPIRLGPLTPDQVARLLAKTSKLHLPHDAPAFDLLRTPHNLRLVVENLDQFDQLTQADTAQALVSLIVQAQLDKAGLDGALDLAVDMGAREELFIDQAKIDTDMVTPMLKAGLLEPIGGRLVFAHQTLFEYFWARVATRDGLVALMRDSSQTTYVRLRLRVALHHLHAADLHRFYDELDQLWSDPNFVKHLRRLIVVFVASLDVPTELDVRWIEQRIREPDWRGTALRRLRSTRWFSPLRDTLDMVMAEPDLSAEATIPLLAAAADGHGVEVVDLLRKHWLRPTRIEAAIRVGRSFSTMTADALELWLDLVRFEACKWVDLMSLVVDKRPDHRRHAGLLVAAFVSARLTQMIIEHGPNLEDNRSWHSPLRMALESLELYDAGSMLSGSERIFVDRIWQPLEAVITLMGNTGRTHLGRLERRSHDLVKVVRTAIRAFASNETNAFATFLRDRGQTKNVTMQWFLFAGLNAIAENHPDMVVEHLVTDPARLTVGANQLEPWDSHDLIANIVTVANAEQLAQLERAILDISPPELDSEQAAKPEASSWWAQRYANLKSWLLELLPEDTRSPEASEWLETLDEDPRRKVRSHERPRVQAAQWIDSPVKSPELDDMANEDIVALFQKYSDDTGWSDAGGDWSVGGSIQLSREFAKTLATDPKRAEALFAGFEPGVQERPIGETLRTWAQDKRLAEDEKRELILRWVRWAEQRGFSSQEFRVDAASALQRIGETDGLDDALCDMLRSWLRAWPRPKQSDGTDPNEDDGDGDRTKPVIDYGGGGMVPSGAFTLIEALLIGLLCRQPADRQQALAAVEEFWWTLEEPRAYAIFGHRLMPHITYISDDNKMRMLRLLERDPERLLRSDTLASLLRLTSTMPEAATAYRRLVEFVRDSGWARGLQAYAEVVAFSALWFELPWAAAIVEELITDVQPEALIAGVLHVATQTLEDPDTKPDKISVCIRWLVTALPTLPTSLDELWLRPLARSRWHRDKRPVEVLRPLFEAAALRPALLSHASPEILWIAARLVDAAPSHVHAFTRAFLSGVKQRGSRLVLRDENADALVTILATLQRRQGHYRHGLELVDLLIEIDPWELDSLLWSLERTEAS